MVDLIEPLTAILLGAVVAGGVAAAIGIRDDGRDRTAPREWTLERSGGLGVAFRGVLVGRGDGDGARLALYRSDDGRLVLERRGRVDEVSVLEDGAAVSERIVAAAGWHRATRALLEDSGLPTALPLPPRPEASRAPTDAVRPAPVSP